MEGITLHARYCFMPNKLGGCGVQSKAGDLFEYASNEMIDPGLVEMLKAFEAAYPYLKFIADQTGILDPFDKKVVEAYWIGNSLLEKIDKREFYQWCHDRYGKQASPKAIKLLVGTVPKGALPHHSFHVFNSYFRNKHFDRLLHFMNECRISSGIITDIGINTVTVEYCPISLGLLGFEFGKPEKKKIYFKIGDKGFITDLKKGDLISFHWDWACDKISEKQSNRLYKVTLQQLKLFNKYF